VKRVLKGDMGAGKGVSKSGVSWPHLKEINKRGAPPKMPENPHILRWSHFACNASNFSKCSRCCLFVAGGGKCLGGFCGKLKMNL